MSQILYEYMLKCCIVYLKLGLTVYPVFLLAESVSSLSLLCSSMGPREAAEDIQGIVFPIVYPQLSYISIIK